MKHSSDGARRHPTPQLPAFCRSRRPISTVVQVSRLRHLCGLLWLVLAIQLSTLLLILAGPVPAPMGPRPATTAPQEEPSTHKTAAVRSLRGA
jgi:hypothetical protein